MGVKLMLNLWVDVVWEASSKSNVHCNNEEFLKYKCPPFNKLVICCTGFTNRLEIENLITENGGKYSGQLRPSTTDILLCKR